MAGAGPAIALMAAGTAANFVANDQANSKRKAILNQMFEGLQEGGKKVGDIGVESAKKYTPELREQELAKVQQGATTRLDEALAAGDTAAPDATRRGRVAQDFTTRAAASDASEMARRAAFNKMYGATAAPGLLMEEEARGDADAASRINQAGSRTRNMANASGVDFSNVRPDPNLQLVGDAASGLGSTMAVGSYYKNLGAQQKGIWDRMFPAKTGSAGGTPFGYSWGAQ